MFQKIEYITLLVKDQDEALKFYTETLGFSKHHDQNLGKMRWLVVAPEGQKAGGLALMLAETANEKKLVGKQAGRYPLMVFLTDDCEKNYEILESRGVKFDGKPMRNPWGMAVQFFDLYGNKFDLVQPT